MYQENCVYYDEWPAMEGKMRACTCSARHNYMKFTSITDDLFPDCTNCKYYIDQSTLKKKLAALMKL